jgi:EAL domain-containing protein (putative c-di-GMP-specific phosphodiesterase class I)
VGGLIREFEVDPGLVQLEITENAVMTDPERAIVVLTRLAELGVRLAVDDFGSGQSSLAYLKTLPIHQLKIDGSFVNDITTNATDAIIVQTCIELAHRLGLEVVAEGVEDAATWHQLTELGCQLAHGFYLAKPMPSTELMDWLADRGQREPVTALGLFS